MILQETIGLLKKKHQNFIDSLTIEDVRIGVYLTAVKLTDNIYGVSSTLPDIMTGCYKNNRDFSDFTPNNILGKQVIELLETKKHNGIIETLRVAALNAISSKIIENSNYKIYSNTDPIDLIDFNSDKTVTIVGAFHSYIQKISSSNSKLFVLELEENTLMDEDKKYYIPADDFSKVLPISDVVLITGSTLVNNTIDGLLYNISPESLIVVVGPSSSIIPDVLFQNNVKIIGATQIINPNILFDIVSQAGAGFHLFKYCAQKICILNE